MSDSQDPNDEIPPELQRAAERIRQFSKMYNEICAPILRAHSQSQAAMFEAFGSIAAMTRSIEASHFRAFGTVLESVSSMQKLQASLIAEVFDNSGIVEVMRQRDELLSLFSSISSGPFANNKALATYSSTQSWTCGAIANTIFGYFIVEASSGTLVSPFSNSRNASTLSLTSQRRNPYGGCPPVE